MKHKKLGQVYTPVWIVNEILKEVEYSGKKILNQKIIDPACGDGIFLIQIIDKIIKEAKKNNIKPDEIKQILEKNVYGFEIDKNEYSKCIENLNNFVKNKIGVNKINWRIYNDNTLIRYKDFINYFDYVVGNPPYIRIHNLDKTTREIIKNNFEFNKGTLDIYISFFELGFKILKKTGVLGYITPNSFLKNSSYKNFRKFLKEQKALKVLVDFKSQKIFKKYSTYTAITVIDFNINKDAFLYKELIDNKIQTVNKIKFDEIDEKSWSFSNKEDMHFIKKIYEKTKYKISDFFEVQYGFATLRDKIFIGEIKKEKEKFVLFNNEWIEKDILKKIVKGSTYKGNNSEIKYIIFPYYKKDNKFVPFSEEELKTRYPKAYKYLLNNKEELLKRDLEKNKKWYEFGRSQGVQTCHREKIVVSNLMKNSINFHLLPEDIYVYSGIFITKKEEIEWDVIVKILNSEEFKKYIMIKGKDFSGGYKSVTTKLIKDFPLIYKDY